MSRPSLTSQLEPIAKIRPPVHRSSHARAARPSSRTQARLQEPPLHGCSHFMLLILTRCPSYARLCSCFRSPCRFHRCNRPGGPNAVPALLITRSTSLFGFQVSIMLPLDALKCGLRANVWCTRPEFSNR